MKQIIGCKNFKLELEKATNNEYEYHYHYPLCLDNKIIHTDPVATIIKEESLDDYQIVCCDLCKSSHKKGSNNAVSSALCFYQVLNKETVNYYIAKGNYIVTPGWLRNWKLYVQEDWQFTKEIATMFFEKAFTKVLVLDTMLDDSVEENVKAFASFINKEYEILPVGMDYYYKYISQSLNITQKKHDDIQEENKKIKNQLINFSMSVELIKNISSFTSEKEIVNRIFDILRMMFMPNSICYIPIIKGKPYLEECNIATYNELKEFLHSTESNVYWLKSNMGFASKVYYGDELIGILVLDEIYLPEYKETYYNTFLSISNVISLALYNSRLYVQVLDVNKDYLQQKSYFEQLFKNSPEMIIITDNDLVVQNTNSSFNKYFTSKGEFFGLNINEFFTNYDTNFLIENDSLTTEYPKSVINFKIDDQIRNIELSKYPIKIIEETVGYYIILSDITERVSMQEKLRSMAFIDSLTGLYNRAYCDEEMNRLSSNRQLPLGIIIGDVNGLKVTNDAFGHIAGDKILIQISKILTTSCRTGDIISRWGGDEFVIILPSTEIGIIQKISERILKMCSEFTEFDYVIPSISLGYAVLESKNKTITETFVEAENMMYENKLLQKSSIRNRIVSSLEGSLFEKSYETEEHAVRVAEMCVLVGQRLGFGSQEISELELLGRLHDIGKLLIDNSLLEKIKPLHDFERKIIQEHSESGYRIAKSIGELSHIAAYILHHHERWDGKGYPNRIKGYEIPIQSRILSIADSIDAMRSKRPYKEKFSNNRVLEELELNKGTQFDPTLIETFIELFFTDSNN